MNEGLLQSHIDDMAFDKNNFGWLSFANGIQKFNGNNFINIPVQPGLPDDKSTTFFSTSKGDLLISHSQGVSKYDISNNKFSLIYRNDPSWNEPVSFIGEDNNTVYFFTGDAAIAEMDINTFAINSQTKTGFKDYKNDSYGKLKYTHNIVNHCIGLYADSSLIVWDLVAKKIMKKAKNTLLTTVFDFWLGNHQEILYISNKKDNRLMKYNFKTGENKTIATYPGDDNKSPRIVFFKWKNKYHLSYFGKIYETDSSFGIQIKELKNFQNQPVTGNYVTNIVRQDRLGNLYLLTANSGFRRIIANNYSLHYYGTEKKENNFIVSVCADKKANLILAGTQGNGLLLFDTLQRLIKNIRNLPGEKGGFTPVCIVKSGDGGYLLFCWGKKVIWRLARNLSDLTAMPVSRNDDVPLPAIEYFSNFIFQDNSICLVHSKGTVYKIDQAKKTISGALLPSAEILGCLLYKNNFVIHSGDELLFIDTATTRVIKKVALKNTGGVRCLTTDKAGNIYVGSNKGIFKLNGNGKLMSQLNKETGLPDECIYALSIDEDGDLWCSTNKGIFKIDKGNGLLQLTKEDGLQENEFNTNAISMADDGEIFFGGVNGVSSFFPSAINNLEEKINVLLTNIKINNKEVFKDTAAWNIKQIDLSYNQNSMAFDFIAMGAINPGRYIYQYKMKGIDEGWIQNNSLQTVHYFLPPGKYVFQMYASRYFNTKAKAIKEISITLHPPFWKTWWFLAIVSIVLLTSFAYAINQYNSRKYQKKVIMLESENKLRLERERISRDLHDNIGAYANAVLYKTELLQDDTLIDKRKELITDIRFASKDIITSLRETIWALKKDNYSAEDCLMRIRNFIQPFTRYYHYIEFKVQGDAPHSVNLHHDKALHLVRIVQESLSNAIKHAEAKNIIVTSLVENNRWKLCVTDDGKGFNLEDKKHLNEGNGLGNMEQRAMSAALIFSISSEINKGTVVSIIC